MTTFSITDGKHVSRLGKPVLGSRGDADPLHPNVAQALKSLSSAISAGYEAPSPSKEKNLTEADKNKKDLSSHRSVVLELLRARLWDGNPDNGVGSFVDIQQKPDGARRE